MKRFLCSLVALGLLVGVTGRTMAQPTYTFATLDVPGASYASTIPTGINSSGQIVGYFQDAAGNDHGFLFDQGSYTTLDVPGGTGTWAIGINDSGQIVGSYRDAANNDRGFLLDQGSYTILYVPGSYGTYAHGINAAGQIVGYYWDHTGQHGFLLDNGSYTTLQGELI
jgi:probable HAF family extracellular repeat protein